MSRLESITIENQTVESWLLGSYELELIYYESVLSLNYPTKLSCPIYSTNQGFQLREDPTVSRIITPLKICGLTLNLSLAKLSEGNLRHRNVKSRTTVTTLIVGDL